jgi:dTDP-4-dehydrorhamnose reductase
VTAGEPPLVAVTGASGYLGRRLVRTVAVRGGRPLAVGRAERIDHTDRDGVLAAFGARRPAAVIHAGAANPGRPVTGFDPVNRDGAAHVAEAAARVGARLVHVSTDVVFDGRRAPYADAPPAPVNHYGASKAAGESAVAARCPDAVIVRTSLIYGLEEPDRGTAGFIERLRSGNALSLFTDAVRQPVWVEDLADGLVRLALDEAGRTVAGTMNLAGRQAIDRASFGRRMLAFWGVDGGDRVVDVSAADHPDVPLDLRLDLTRAEALGLDCRGVDEVLAAHRRPAGPPG